MYRYSVGLVFLVACLGFAIPVHAGQQAGRTAQNKKVWTNSDLAELRARGLLSIAGPAETEAKPAQAATAPAPTAWPVYASRLEDPEWYAEQAAGLQTQLNAQRAALAQAQDALEQARDLRAAIGGINMTPREAPGVTPEASIAALAQQVRQTQERFDELADLARRNDIPPGVLRAAA